MADGRLATAPLQPPVYVGFNLFFSWQHDACYSHVAGTTNVSTPQRLKDEIRNHSTTASLFVINAVAWCSYYSEEGGQ